MSIERVVIGNAVLYRGPRYFDIACRRIEDAQRQAQLIPHEMPAAEQVPMFG